MACTFAKQPCLDVLDCQVARGLVIISIISGHIHAKRVHTYFCSMIFCCRSFFFASSNKHVFALPLLVYPYLYVLWQLVLLQAGPKLASVTGIVLVVVGSLLLGFSNDQTFQSYIPAILLIGELNNWDIAWEKNSWITSQYHNLDHIITNFQSNAKNIAD